MEVVGVLAFWVFLSVIYKMDGEVVFYLWFVVGFVCVFIVLGVVRYVFGFWGGDIYLWNV